MLSAKGRCCSDSTCLMGRKSELILQVREHLEVQLPSVHEEVFVKD